MEYQRPPVSLLKDYSRDGINEYDYKKTTYLRKKLIQYFTEFRIQVDIKDSRITPTALVFDLKPKKADSFLDWFCKKHLVDLSLRLEHYVEAMINPYDRSLVCLSVMKTELPIFGLKGCIENPDFLNDTTKLKVPLGVDRGGKIHYLDLYEAPHLLVVGSTGSGKTTFLDCLIASILYKASPEDVKLILIDFKYSDFKTYEDLPHLLTDVLNTPDSALETLEWLEDEMNRRISLFNERHVKTLDQYNATADIKKERIVLIIDEYKDLIDENAEEFNTLIENLAAKGRIVGIHLVLSTQVPSNRIVNASIKANFRHRIAFAFTEKKEYSFLFDRTQQIKLIGKGDLVSSVGGTNFVHLQAPYISYKDEILAITDYFRDNMT